MVTESCMKANQYNKHLDVSSVCKIKAHPCVPEPHPVKYWPSQTDKPIDVFFYSEKVTTEAIYNKVFIIFHSPRYCCTHLTDSFTPLIIQYR